MSRKFSLFLTPILLLTLTSSFINNDQSQKVIYSFDEAKSKVEKMADELWAIRELDSKKALEIGFEAIQIAEDYNLNSQIARISNFLGVIYIHYLYNTKKGISYLHRALEVSLYKKDSVQLAYAYNNLGDAFLLSGNTPLALKYSKNSLNIFERIIDSSGIAYGYVNIGSVHRREGDYELAIAYFMKAKLIREKINDELGGASILLELAQTYHSQGNLEEALLIFLDSYEHNVKINNVLYSALCLSWVAHVYLDLGEFDQAFESYIKAIELFNQRNHRSGLLDSYLGLSQVYAKKGMIKEGKEILHQSLEIAKKMGLASKVLKTHEYDVKFYKMIGEYKKASEHSEEFLELYDSVLSAQKFETLTELQKNFSNEFNLKLTQQNLINKKIKERYLHYIIGLMILLIGVIIRRYVLYRKLNIDLEETLQSKDKMFSVISHDLKNPFNSLLGFTEVLIDEVNDQEFENVKNYAKIINQAAQENLKLLTNLLDWSRSQTGQIKYQPEPLLIGDLFDELKEFFLSDITQNKIRLSFKSEISENIMADSNILRTVLINLISNALKYTESNGSIEVIAETNMDKISIKIIDDGIGMSEATKQTLFNPKSIRSVDGLRNEKGTGLGLMICSELIQIHNGQIKVLSKLGVGSTFIISFPSK